MTATSSESWRREGERIDDLQRNGLRILQKESGFQFGMDAVLLSGYVKVADGDRVMDLCSGNGIIPLLLSAKTRASQIVGLELQDEVAAMAQRSVALNHLQDRVRIDCGDVREAVSCYGGSSFDVVTCNPPYMKAGHGLVNDDAARIIARHEVTLTLEEAVSAAAALVRPRGKVCFVHRPFRLTELIVAMHRFGIEAKRMRLVYPYADAEPNMVLIEGIRGAKPYLTVEPPLVVYDAPGVYAQEIWETYGY